MVERYHEYDPIRETRRNISELDKLLAKLIESGPELDPQHKAQIRQYISQFLGPLGLTGKGSKGAEGLLEVRQRLNVEHEVLPTPPTYPSLAVFQKNLLRVVLSDGSPQSYRVPENVKATDIARNGDYEWREIQSGNNQYTLDYLYDLGKVMVSPVVYEALFPVFDSIEVGRDWWIDNGPQRALVLRTLGPTFVTRSRMDAWVKVRRSGLPGETELKGPPR